MQLSNSATIQMFYFNGTSSFMDLVPYFRHFGVNFQIYELILNSLPIIGIFIIDFLISRNHSMILTVLYFFFNFNFGFRVHFATPTSSEK